jgi:hypothetical protein
MSVLNRFYVAAFCDTATWRSPVSICGKRG